MAKVQILDSASFHQMGHTPTFGGNDFLDRQAIAKDFQEKVKPTQRNSKKKIIIHISESNDSTPLKPTTKNSKNDPYDPLSSEKNISNRNGPKISKNSPLYNKFVSYSVSSEKKDQGRTFDFKSTDMSYSKPKDFKITNQPQSCKNAQSRDHEYFPNDKIKSLRQKIQEQESEIDQYEETQKYNEVVNNIMKEYLEKFKMVFNETQDYYDSVLKLNKIENNNKIIFDVSI